MAWGKAKPQAPRSLISQLLPLVIFFAVIAGAAWVGYQIYMSVTQMKGNVSQRMGKKNLVLTKDGMRVGVKHVGNEREVDATQRYLVNAWNLRADKNATAKKSK